MRPLTVVGFVVLLTGCFGSGHEEPVAEPSSTTSTGPTATTATTATTTVPEPWGHEAYEFFEALRFMVPDRTDRFYSPSATFEGSLFDHFAYERTAPQEGLRMVVSNAEWGFVAANEAAIAGHLYDGLLPGLTVFQIDDGRIVHVTHEVQQGFEGYWRDPDPLGPRLGVLHDRYFPAWASGDADLIAGLYQPGAARSDGLFDSIRVLDVGNWIERIESLVGGRARYEPVSTTALDTHGEVVDVLAAYHDWGEDISEAHVIFDVIGSDCTLRLLAEWEIDGDRIAAEEILYDVESLRRCADRTGVDLPDGWWTGLEVPEPFLETVTGQVTTEDGLRIDIVNGSPEQIELVEWGLGRFTAAGLALPEVATVAFPPTKLCLQGEHTGYASLGSSTVRLDVCGDDAATGERRTVLHELGHAWNEQQIDEATRQAFLELRGLEAWTPSDPDTSPYERAIEQAAETIAWGLMDQPIGIKLPDTTPEDLDEAFWLLTGVEPLNTP